MIKGNDKKIIYFMVACIFMMAVAALLNRQEFKVMVLDQEKDLPSQTDVPVSTDDITTDHDPEDFEETGRDMAGCTLTCEASSGVSEIRKSSLGTVVETTTVLEVLEISIPCGDPGLYRIKQEIMDYIKDKEGTYGIYYYNLETGDEFGINENEVFHPASTIKVPVNYYIIKKAEEGEICLYDKRTYLKDDFQYGTGIIKNDPVGSKYDVRTLCEYSIVYSDNIATNMLYDIVGKKTIADCMRTMGGEVVTDDLHATTPKDLGTYLKHVYRYDQENPEWGGMLIEWLSDTVYNMRIPRFLPDDLKIAHKIGNLEDSLHDVGIVYTDSPYIVCLFSTDVDPEPTYDILATLSKMIYDYVASKKQKQE